MTTNNGLQKWGHTKFSGKLIVVVTFIIVLTISCSKDRTTGTPEPVVYLTSPAVDAGKANPTTPAQQNIWCDRPYSETSIWNSPIDWEKAKIHPQSDLMMAAFFEDNKWIGSDTSQYAPNIYLVSDTTPLVPVHLQDVSFRDAIDDVKIQYGERGGTVWMPLPVGARPSPGTDAQLAVVNLDSGEEWGLRQGDIDSDGNWSAGGAYRYQIGNSGIPPLGFAMRGAGIGQLAGIIRPCEVSRGYIGHAVTLSYDFPCAPDVCASNGWPAVIPPFTKTDGKGGSRYDIPEGARIVIRSDISKEEIRLACQDIKGCIAWAFAMQEYGGFIVDDGGHPKTYAEGDATAHWDPEIWSSDMLRHIPEEWYAVLDWNSSLTKAQSN
jgi:hypothetical protein